MKTKFAATGLAVAGGPAGSTRVRVFFCTSPRARRARRRLAVEQLPALLWPPPAALWPPPVAPQRSLCEPRPPQPDRLLAVGPPPGPPGPLPAPPVRSRCETRLSQPDRQPAFGHQSGAPGDLRSDPVRPRAWPRIAIAERRRARIGARRRSDECQRQSLASWLSPKRAARLCSFSCWTDSRSDPRWD